MTPEQRRLRAQVAANARWSRPMAREDQADAARSAIYGRLEREVDPQGHLTARLARPSRALRRPSAFGEDELREGTQAPARAVGISQQDV